MQNAMHKLAFSDKQWTWLEISWLLLSAFGILHLQQQNNFFKIYNSAICDRLCENPLCSHNVKCSEMDFEKYDIL